MRLSNGGDKRTTVAEMTGNIMNEFFLQVDFAINELLQKGKCFRDSLHSSWHLLR